MVARRHRSLIACITLLAGGVTIYLVTSMPSDIAPHGTPQPGIILSDCDGAIKLAACNINSARHAALRNTELFNHIVNAFPSRVQLIALTNDAEAFTIASDPHPGRVSFVDLPATEAFTIWPQDPFVVVRNPHGGIRLVAPVEFARADDAMMPQTLSQHLDVPIVHSDLHFEGGNIVANRRHVFIGADTIVHNAIERDENATLIVRRFEALFGRPVLVIGPTPQPVGHIDMILTPLSDDRLLLADPGAGATLARDALTQKSEQVRTFEERCEQRFFGDPSIEQLRTLGGHTLTAPDVQGKTAPAIDHTLAIAATLDRLATELSAHGYEVHRVPFVHGPPLAPTGPDASRETETPHPTYPTMTYNNVLIERVDQQATVYLPQYGLSPLDDAATHQWERLGFNVRPVTGFAISAMHGGSLRCCVKVLQRTVP